MSKDMGVAAAAGLPWTLVQEAERPWRIKIMSGDEVILEEHRWAFSSADKTAEERITCAHFGPKDRDAAAAGNARQIDRLAFIVHACNSVARLEEVNAKLVEAGNLVMASAQSLTPEMTAAYEAMRAALAAAKEQQQ